MKRFILGLLLCLAVALPAAAQALTKIEPLTIATDSDAHMFTVEIADTDASRQRGLMFRQRLPEDRGMLFDFGKPREVAMWMKNTYIPLDMLFIRADGTVVYVAENTVPKSLETIGVREKVLAVLELAGGTSKKLGIRSGDIVHHRIFERAPSP